MRPLKRTPALDGLDLYRRLDDPSGETVIYDPARVEAVLEQIRSGLEASLSNEHIVRGWRAQALFASTVVALDGCVMMTQIDLGEVFVDGEDVKAPDFFLHLRDGTRVLVDVKSVNGAPEHPDYIETFSASQVRRLRRFGELYGAKVYLAFYFAYHPIWLLVSLDDLKLGPGGGYRITFADAYVQNKMSVIGDRVIGCRAPLELVLLPDQSQPHHVKNGSARFTVGSFDLHAGGGALVDAHAKKVALFLLMHGDWDASQYVEVEGSGIVRVTVRAAPDHDADDDPTRDPRPDFIGALSTMYARLFEAGTSGAEGPTGLELRADPGMLVTLIPHDYSSEELPLWRFEIRPGPPSTTPE